MIGAANFIEYVIRPVLQKMMTGTLDRRLDKYDVKTQEAYSVLRTLHALHGEEIRVPLREYLDSDEAWDLTEESFQELWSLL